MPDPTRRDAHLITSTDIIISWDDDEPAEADVVALDVTDDDHPG